MLTYEGVAFPWSQVFLMRVLAFDTTTAACSVALWCDGTVEASHCNPMMHSQAEALVPNIEQVLTEAGRGYDSVDRFAVTVGPGSFTGVRVGLATARGLGLATGSPVIGLLTSEVLAREAIQKGRDTPVAVAIDARRAAVYLQCFDGSGEALDEPVCMTPEDAAQHLVGHVWQLVGDGAYRVSPHVDRQIHSPGPTFPDAVVLAAMAAVRPIPDRPPAPVYVRPPDAVLPEAGGRLRP